MKSTMKSTMKSYDHDLEDADAWVAKALLLGAKLRQHQERIDDVAWRWTAVVPNETFRIGAFHADWPGRAAKDIVEAVQRYASRDRA